MPAGQGVNEFDPFCTANVDPSSPVIVGLLIVTVEPFTVTVLQVNPTATEPLETLAKIPVA
jgi:hypothetical protein